MPPKPILCISLVAAFLLGAGTAFGVTLSVPDTSGAPGDTVLVPVSVDDATGIAGIEFILAYDAGVLMAMDAQLTPLTVDFHIQYGHKPEKSAITMARSTGITIGEESFSPPMMGMLGISVPLFAQRLRVAADFEQPLVEGNRAKLRVGCEGRFTNLYVRAGYTHAFGGRQPDAWTGWTAGIGFLYDRWQMDYGVAPSRTLGDVHRVSMTMESGPPPLQIYVTSPADGDTVHEAQVPLTGFMKGEKARAFWITVNGQKLRGISKIVWKNTFSEEVSLKEGDNTIEVTAQAPKGPPVTKAITVVYQPVGPGIVERPEGGPEIHVEEPEDGQVVYSEVVKVSGYASDDQGIQRIEVFVNGEKRLSKLGAGKKFFPFSKSVNLDIGDNQIQIVAYAVDGRTSTSICTVKLEGVVIRRTDWALLIAADTYQYWPELKTPISDADSLRALLISKYGFEPDHIVTLYNEQATRTNIIDALTGFARKLGPEDNLLIYYAGHGQYDETLEMGYWIPFEAQYTVSGYLENAVIQSYVARIPAQHILMVVDACYSGTLLAERRAEISPDRDRYFREVDKRRSRQVMTSGGQEPVWDVGYGRHSIFAYYFLQALRENTRRYLTAGSLFDQIKIPVARNSRQTPIFRALMDSKDEGGEFIFVLEERFIRE